MNKTHSLARRLLALPPGKLAACAAALAVTVVAAGVTTAAGSTTPRVTFVVLVQAGACHGHRRVPAQGVWARDHHDGIAQRHDGGQRVGHAGQRRL